MASYVAKKMVEQKVGAATDGLTAPFMGGREGDEENQEGGENGENGEEGDDEKQPEDKLGPNDHLIIMCAMASCKFFYSIVKKFIILEYLFYSYIDSFIYIYIYYKSFII